MKHFIRLSLLLITIFASNASAKSPLVEQPWLKDHLSERITAYVRVPHPLFFFADADTPLQPLYQDERYITSLAQIKQALLTRVASLDLDPEARAAMNVFAAHLRAPVELTIPEYVNFSKPPSIILATKLDYADAESFDKDFATLFKNAPIAFTPEQAGKGTLMLKPMRLTGKYHYSPESGKLLVTLGENHEKYQALLTAKPTSSTIARSENLIDDNGQGLFAVLRPSPMMFMMLPLSDKEKVVFAKLALNQIKEIALGLGVANNRPKLKLVVDMPKTGLRKLIPSYPMVNSVNHHGRLSSVISYSLPNEQLVNDAMAMFDIKEYDKFKAEFNKKTGLPLSELLALFGRNYTIFTDDNGSYAAMNADFEDKLTALVKKQGLDIETLTLDGQAVKHLNLAPLYEKLMGEVRENAPEDIDPMFFSLLTNNHFYWIKEGDAILLSDLPQPLLARSQSKATATLADAFKTHNLATDDTFVNVLVNYRNLSQRAYYRQLSLLNRLGDVANVPVNIEQYKTANALNFKRYGAVGVSIDNAGELLTIEYSFENGLLDVVEMISQTYGQLGSVWVAGILSAIAIPAYQDYTVRAKVNNALNAVAPLKVEIAEALAEGAPLEEIDTKALQASLKTLERTSGIASITAKDANIAITLKHISSRIDGRTITLEPEVSKSGNIVKWKCSAKNIAKKHLPGLCRKR